MLIKEKGKSSCYTSSMETQLPKRNNATKIKPFMDLVTFFFFFTSLKKIPIWALWIVINII